MDCLENCMVTELMMVFSITTDLVLVNLKEPHTRSDETSHYKCGWTPFAGRTFKSKVQTTIISGVVKYHKGKVVSDQRGQCLEFNHEF